MEHNQMNLSRHSLKPLSPSNPLNYTNEQNRPRDLFEPYVEGGLKLPARLANSNPNPNFPCDFPDWVPDFSERINIESESIELALDVLGLSKFEFNSMSVQDLKQRRMECGGRSKSSAINILIYYKSKSDSQHLKPIQHNGFQPNKKIHPEFVQQEPKIYPEFTPSKPFKF